MTNAQDALTLTADVNADLAKIVEAGVLRAHQTGLKAVAALIAEAADEIAKAQIDLDDLIHEDGNKNEETIERLRRESIRIAAKSEVLTSLNDKVMARMKAVDVLIGARP